MENDENEALLDNNRSENKNNKPKKINVIKKVKKNNAVKSKLATTLLPIIFKCVIIIICIIIIIGIIMFLITMPSMVMQKLKKISSTLGNYVAAFFGADVNTMIDSKEIFNTLDYMEEMGYDVKGFGFLTDYYTDINDSEIKESLADVSDYTLDDKQGVIRDADGKIILAKSDFIFTYIASDNYIYTLKNANLATIGSSSGLLGTIFGGIKSLLYKLSNFLFYRLNNLLGITKSAQDAWGKGLLNVYYQGGQVGEKGDLYAGGLFNFDTIKIDTDKKQLVLKKGELFKNNQEVRYNLDGWVGRYGMPLEFLVSIHIATMMPDLAYDMATAFPTNVNIILNPVKNNTSYQPYVSEVLNHWYRDVYYVVDQNELTSKGINIIDYDYDYQAVYKERWTLYETFNEDDYDLDFGEYAKNNYGDFKLYIINKEGYYCTSSDISEIASNPKVKQCGDNYIYLGTKEEANDEDIIVSKKAVVQDINDEKIYEDVDWNKIGSKWLAYKLVPLWDGDIKQTGEGLRTETNAAIKKMFLVNTYFRYDGTTSTAEVITALRKKIKDDYLSNSTSEYGALNALTTSGSRNVNGFNVPNVYDFTENDGFKRSYSATELGLPDDFISYYTDDMGNKVKNEKEFKVSDYVGQVSLNQDSLNAFNMLENMHTLDADYIYRDFKELVVELGYFSKEELTDEAPRLLEWVVPETASIGYPKRNLDKRESEYGTMIHSKGDIDAFEAYDGTKVLDILPTKVPYTSPDKTHNGYYNRLTGVVRKDDGSYLPVPGDMFIRATVPTGYKMNSTNEEIAKQAKTNWLKMASVEDGVEYRKAESDFTDTFRESLDDSSKRNVNDAVFVSWVLKDLGVDVDDILANFEGDWTNPHDISRLCVEFLSAEIIFNYGELQPGDIMAYVFDEKGEEIELVDILGEQQKDGSYLRYGCNEVPSIGDTKAKETIDEDTFNSLSLCFGMRIAENGYVGYDGNEMVVSPVTGILLEYGTYSSSNVDSLTGEEYRTNVDLKFGPVAPSTNGDETQYINKTVSDKVGYAKILVLDTENYLYLEQSTENRWNESTGGESLVTQNGRFRETLIDDDDSTAVEKVQGRVSGYSFDTSMRWSRMEQTVYGYKEFAESYQRAGIAGYIIYIDGFVCEEPDPNLKDITKDIPNGNKITIDTYKKITKSNADDRTIQLPSEYIEEDYYELSSTKAVNKHKAEVMVKYLSAGSLYLEGGINNKDGSADIDSLIFIKEGTILGRTMTDKELLESSNFRAGAFGSYDENRSTALQLNNEKTDKIIGNYIRVIMRDLDKTPVENVEEYYKLGDKEEYDWFSLLLWEPYEAGGVDRSLEGPENISTCTPGELAIGIAQWTDLLDHYHEGRNGNGINSVLRRCVKDDYDLCWPLESQIMGNVDRWCQTTGDSFTPTSDEHYEKNQISAKTGKKFDGLIGLFDICIKRVPDKDLHGYGITMPDGSVVPEVVSEIWCRWDGHEDLKENAEEHIKESDLQQALTKVCNMNREKFFKLQRQFARESFLEPILLEHPWVADRPVCVQGILLHVFLAGDQTMKWLSEDMTDEEILAGARHYIANRKSTAADGDGNEGAGRAWNEPEIAYKLLDKTLNKYEVELWVRTAVSSVLKDAGMNYR